MIIDAHAHACGEFLKGEDIVRILDENDVDKVVLVPGEVGSDKGYSFPELSTSYPNRDLEYRVPLFCSIPAASRLFCFERGKGDVLSYPITSLTVTPPVPPSRGD